MTQGIFISYRRDTGSTMARMIYDRLRLEKKYECFLDVEKLNAGNFRDNIASEMDKCDIFLLVLSKNALNRCSNPSDNVRQELETAFEKGLAIIPIMTEDFVWPEKMPEGLENIQNFNAIPYVQVYSEQFFERLYSFIDTARAEERAKESAVRAAITKERLKDRGKASADSVSYSGQYTDGAAKGTAKKNSRWPLIVVSSIVVVAVIALAVTVLDKGNPSPDVPVSSEGTEDAAQGSASEPSVWNEPQQEISTEELIPTAENILPNTNADDAAAIPLNTKILGTVTEGKYWYYSFYTTEKAEYIVSCVNKSGVDRVGVSLCDENGNEIEKNSAAYGGRTASVKAELEPNTTYLLKLYNNGTNYYGTDPLKTSLDYALIVFCPSKAAIKPLWGNLNSDAADSAAGTNQDEAVLIPFDAKITGTADKGKFWYYAFRTTSASEYAISAVNKTGKDKLGVDVCDIYGDIVGKFNAPSNGSVETLSVSLMPDTVYYIRVYNNGINYTGTDPLTNPLDYRITVQEKN